MLSVVIYVAVGYHVFHQRNQLRNLTLSNQARDISGATEKVCAAPVPPSVLTQPWVISSALPHSYLCHPPFMLTLVALLLSSHKAQQSYGTVTTEVQVEVSAESSGSQTPPSTPAGSIAPVLHKPSPGAAAHDPWGSPDDDVEPVSPTTAGHTNKPFTSTAIISSGRPRETKKPGLFNKTAQAWGKFKSKLANLDPIKLAYLRTSFVFAISILVTWTPSSINRVYSLIYPARTSYALNLAGAVVLPLQGLWNAIIFAATSWSTLKDEFRELRRGGCLGLGSRPLSDGQRNHAGSGFCPRRGGGPESRELPTIPRLANVRVIRGGSL